ncbi:MAG: hypothetical protein U1E38_03475 [Rhodospirillales bacterium]
MIVTAASAAHARAASADNQVKRSIAQRVRYTVNDHALFGNDSISGGQVENDECRKFSEYFYFITILLRFLGVGRDQEVTTAAPLRTAAGCP